jgi:hypothetical protein
MGLGLGLSGNEWARELFLSDATQKTAPAVAHTWPQLRVDAALRLFIPRMRINGSA